MEAVQKHPVEKRHVRNAAAAVELRQVSRSMFRSVCETSRHVRNCEGEGRIVKDPCLACSGEGRVQGESTIKVTVPARRDRRKYITSCRSREMPGGVGGPAGDLIVIMEEEPHQNFKRNGDDIIFDLWIKLSNSSHGRRCRSPTLTGRRPKLVIDPGTPAGRMCECANGVFRI